jgi:hypothetical protein
MTTKIERTGGATRKTGISATASWGANDGATTRREEDEMYGLVEYELLTQRNGEDGLEGATESPSTRVGEERRARSYVVRDLSWELARYLDAGDFPATGSARPDTADGN